MTDKDNSESHARDIRISRNASEVIVDWSISIPHLTYSVPQHIHDYLNPRCYCYSRVCGKLSTH